MTLIPILRLFNRLHLTGTFAGFWIAHTAYGLPLAIYLLSNFIGGIPEDLFESAFLDGATHFQIFYRLVLPISVPGIASLAIFQFMWVWNNLLVALIYPDGTLEVAPMTVTISNLVNSSGGGWDFLTSVAFISMILPLVVFFSLQCYFIRQDIGGLCQELMSLGPGTLFPHPSHCVINIFELWSCNSFIPPVDIDLRSWEKDGFKAGKLKSKSTLSITCSVHPQFLQFFTSGS